MQGVWKAGRLVRVLRDRSSILFNTEQLHGSDISCILLQWRYHHTNLVSSACSAFYGSRMQMEPKCQREEVSSLNCHVLHQSSYSSQATEVGSGSTETVKELYEKILRSIVDQRTAPPNAYLWSLISKCANQDDIKLLFDILRRLRIFRLSNLRIHDNFNCALCQEVTKACIRADAISLGKKPLYKHNIYGLSPNVGSAHHLLMYAKKHNDVDLMVDIMKLLVKNDLPLQPGTADLVFSICYQNDNWELMCKYGKKFVKGGARLRPRSFDLWMEFAAKMGDVDSLWKIEKVRSESTNYHTISRAFSCAKGLLIENKSEEAAAMIQVIYENLSVSKRQGIREELEKLVNEWPVEVIKRQKEEKRKELARTLQKGISDMVNALSNLGAKMDVNVESVTLGV